MRGQLRISMPVWIWLLGAILWFINTILVFYLANQVGAMKAMQGVSL